jgi:rsbT antagonist protein RsbS
MHIAGAHLTPIGDGDFLLEPTRGMDIANSDDLIEEILVRVQMSKGQRLYYDLSELAIIDPVYYQWMRMLARACKTVNITMVCIHMQPTAAFGLAQFLQETPPFVCALDVERNKI